MSQNDLYHFEWKTHPHDSISGTCERCREMNGREFTPEQAEKLRKEHVNCVCSLDMVVGPIREANQK